MNSHTRKSGKENKTGDKMILTLKEDTINEIIRDEKNKEKAKKIVIFNNKKNNVKCSDLLKSVINTEKELLVMPYAKKKQKINKTLDELGRSNGISYPTLNVIKGIISNDNSYKAIIRGEDDNKYNSKTHKFSLSKLKYNTAEINLDNNEEEF